MLIDAVEMHECIAEIEESLDAARALHSTNPPEALARADALFARSEAIGYVKGCARARMVRGMCGIVLGNHAEAFANLEEALEQGRALPDAKLISDCLHPMGILYFQKAEYAESLACYNEALVLRNDLGDRKGQITALNSLGTSHATLGHFAEAATFFRDSLRIAQEMGDHRAEMIIGNNLGLLRCELGDYENGVAQLEQTATLAEQLQESYYQITARTNLCSNTIHLGRYAESEAQGLKALELAKASGSLARQTVVWQALGQLYARTGRVEESVTAFHTALACGQESGYLQDFPRTYFELGLLAEGHADFAQAETYYRKGLELAQQHKTNKHLSTLNKALSELFRQRGDFPQALCFYEAYHAAEQTIQREAAQNHLTVAMARLDLEKATTALERARQDAERERIRNQELTEVNTQLTELNQQNEVLMARLEKQTAHLAQQAIRDPLTGLYNRRYLDSVMEQEMVTAVQNGQALPIAILDLDNFKQINDRFSHQTGDVVLTTAAKILRKCSRPGDILVRYGGEEFLILLPGATPQQALDICEQIRASLANHNWKRVHPELVVTVSIGVCCDPLTDPKAALLHADKHLYRAKCSGKNAVVGGWLGGRS